MASRALHRKLFKRATKSMYVQYQIQYISIYKNQNIHTSKTILPRRRTATYLCGARLEPSGAMAVMLGGAMVAMVSRIQAWQTKYTYITPSYIKTLLQQKNNLYLYVICINMYIIHRQQKWTADRFPKRKLFGV